MKSYVVCRQHENCSTNSINIDILRQILNWAMIRRDEFNDSRSCRFRAKRRFDNHRSSALILRIVRRANRNVVFSAVVNKKNFRFFEFLWRRIHHDVRRVVSFWQSYLINRHNVMKTYVKSVNFLCWLLSHFF